MTQTFPKQTDICIIGAGPTGATTSMFLCKMGIPHLIVEKDTFPRDKICGDGLDLKVMRVLNHFDPNSAYELLQLTEQYGQSWGMRFISSDGFVKDMVYEPKEGQVNFPMFCTAKRLHFDSFLVDKIDRNIANVQQGAEVKNIERVEGGLNLTIHQNGAIYEVFTKMVVGADGDHSVVLRKLDERKIDRRHYAAGLRQYYKGIDGMHPKGLLEVYFPKSMPLSYFWIFPLPNGEANVGYGMTSSMVSQKKINLKEKMAEIINNDAVMGPRFKNAVALEKPQGWGLPLASKRKQNYGDNYLLAGDAGSLICPTTGEGIGTGMLSGYIAAHYIQRALKNNDFSAESFKNFHRESYKRLSQDIMAYNFILNSFPEYWVVPFVNFLLKKSGNTLKNMPKWLDTAFNKEIEINM
jgi:menaquinone-9 beta-reductase